MENENENVKKKPNQTFRITLFAMTMIIILTIALVRVVFIGFDTAKELESKESEITKLNAQIDKLEKENEELKKEDEEEEKKTPNKNKKVMDAEDVVELLKNGGEYDYLRISSITEDDDKYLATANYYVPITITEEEYNDMSEEESITINEKEYTFEKEDNKKVTGYGYGYIYEVDEDKNSGYSVYKTEDGYIFLRDVGGVSITIDEEEKEISFYIEEDTIVSEITSDETTLEEYLSENEGDYKLDTYKMTVVYDDDDQVSLELDKR